MVHREGNMGWGQCIAVERRASLSVVIWRKAAVSGRLSSRAGAKCKISPDRVRTCHEENAVTH